MSECATLGKGIVYWSSGCYMVGCYMNGRYTRAQEKETKHINYIGHNCT